MTGQPVLIAAYSGRALAASARRAGFIPLVADAFGDADTRAMAGGFAHLPDAVRSGFRAKRLLPALSALADNAQRRPVGVVLGSGFEDCPRLIETLATHFQLIGNSGEIVRRAKDPVSFFVLLDQLGVGHPETRTTAPDDADGWLMKRVGGSGGSHIRDCWRGARPRPHHYYQRRVTGTPVSAFAIACTGRAQVVGFTRQWCAPGAGRPCRYGGACGPIRLDQPVAVSMTAAVQAVAAALDLEGIVSFDFVVAEGCPYLLEVNPRPGATLDVLDDGSGGLFRAHLSACLGENIGDLSAPGPSAKAAAVLYADRGPLTIGRDTWPDWVADRPAPGVFVAAGRPISTALAEGATADRAEGTCRARLERLANLLYGRAVGKERRNDHHHGTRAQRIGAGGEAR